MSIKLYTDKSEIFECNVSLEGASIKDSKLRAILKFDDKNLMVEGKIKSNGKGEIVLPKLKNISQDGEVGKMELEVIAEDAYFQPYEETFQVITSKKAKVEVLSKTKTKPKIVIEKVAFSCNTASGGTHVGNLQLSATGNSAENGAVSTGTEIVGAGATYVNTGLNATEADLDFNAAGVTLVQSGVVVATSLIHLYACTTTTLDGDFTAGRYTVQVEYSVL